LRDSALEALDLAPAARPGSHVHQVSGGNRSPERFSSGAPGWVASRLSLAGSVSEARGLLRRRRWLEALLHLRGADLHASGGRLAIVVPHDLGVGLEGRHDLGMIPAGGPAETSYGAIEHPFTLGEIAVDEVDTSLLILGPGQVPRTPLS